MQNTYEGSAPWGGLNSLKIQSNMPLKEKKKQTPPCLQCKKLSLLAN